MGTINRRWKNSNVYVLKPVQQKHDCNWTNHWFSCSVRNYCLSYLSKKMKKIKKVGIFKIGKEKVGENSKLL